MKWLSLAQHDIFGVRFALNVFVASAILWYFLHHVAATNPVWAIASMIAASEPVVKEAARMFRSRIINVAVGCGVGLVVLVVGGSRDIKLPFALAITVLISSYLVNVKTMWRQAPITAAIVIASGLESHSKLTGMEHGLRKVGEVLLGCFMGLAVSWLMAKVWPLPHPPEGRGA
ncbi:MAG TPA: FUSC family protein [Thermoanaerobaculia bacterium]|nr:FUSC family protein [Thermoanaerobaculia bacterium]